MEDFCILCNNSLADFETVTVKKKGVETIKKCSIKRDDGLERMLDGIEELVLHVSCRKTYINEKMINSHLNKKKYFEFDFNTKCIFCNHDADEAKPGKELVRTIKLRKTKESIVSYAFQRGDTVSEMILRRIKNVDLVAVQAKYHRTCYDKFRFATSLSSETGSRKRGRPENERTIQALDDIHTFIQSNNEDCQFTINELKSAVTGVCPDDRTIIKKLKEKYGDQVKICSSPGKPTLFCFRDPSYEILDDAWYAFRCTDAKEEKLRVVRTAASIILEDIKSTPYNTSQYPPLDELVESVKVAIPESLNTLLDQLIVKDKKDIANANIKSIAIAHAIIMACRSRSCSLQLPK